MVSSSAFASSVPSVQDVSDPVVGAARYDAVPALMDSLLHDVRNPLNALAIHLEVLSEKLKGESGQVPATQEKNLKAMREQIQRVDGLLKLFSDFIVFRGAGPSGDAPLSDATGKALDVLGHESRRRRLQVQRAIEPDVQARLEDTTELGFFLVQVLMRAFNRADPGGTVVVAVRAEGARAVLEVQDGSPAPEQASDTVAALTLRAAQLGIEFDIRAGSCRLVFPRA
ncbi:sensor histidine kinase [Corallococcus sicarius]|uniref:histidine kinase n=1 Tax=Corallococcus sicarius TaxID=2316726 RepID=A0A3A8MSM0_9BACT|nr:sensor histidine kinase [Corallococcus sicarius]